MKSCCMMFFYHFQPPKTAFESSFKKTSKAKEIYHDIRFRIATI